MNTHTQVAEGAITVELATTRIDKFDEYMRSLTPYNNRRNPWFREYWEALFSCKLADTDGINSGLNPSSSSSSSLSSSVASGAKVTVTALSADIDPDMELGGDGSADSNNTVPLCSPDLRIDQSMGYIQETKVQFVVDAVYAFAHALHAAWQRRCHQGQSYFGRERNGHIGPVCKDLKELDGGDFYKLFLLNVDFMGKLVQYGSGYSRLLSKLYMILWILLGISRLRSHRNIE